MPDELRVITDGTFVAEITSGAELVVVHFMRPGHADSARVRQALGRVFKWEARARVMEVDAAACSGLVSHLRIDVVPSVLFFRGGAEVGRLMGLRPDAHYAVALDTALCAPAGAEMIGALDRT